MSEQSERYKAMVAKIGTQTKVAKALGIGLKTMNARCQDGRAIKPEAFLALEALARHEARKDFQPLTGMVAVFANGDEGDIVHHDPVDGPTVVFPDGTRTVGGEFTVQPPKPVEAPKIDIKLVSTEVAS